MDELRISWSALRVHEQCKMRGKLLRDGKKVGVQNIRVFFHGTVADRAMREWLNNPDLPAGAMRESIARIMDEEEARAHAKDGEVVKWKHRADRDEVRSFCVELVDRLEPILREYVTPFEYEPAKRFKAPIKIPDLRGNPTPVWLVGEMDVLVRDVQNWAIWDLKATKDDSYWRKTIGQLTFYDVALGAMFGGATSHQAGLIQPMCKERIKVVGITDEDRRVLMSRVVSMAHDIWRKDFSFRDDPEVCFHPPCPVKHACPRFIVPRERSRQLTLSEMKALSVPV